MAQSDASVSKIDSRRTLTQLYPQTGLRATLHYMAPKGPYMALFSAPKKVWPRARERRTLMTQSDVSVSKIE